MASQMHRIWQIRPAAAGEGSLLDRLLSARGLAPADRERFLEPSLGQMHDPMLLNDMEQACDTILEAMRRSLPLIIHGDYDVDGITAAAMLTRFFRFLGHEPRIMIPDRFSEGYGLSETAADTLISQGAGLLLTVDCGITSLEEIDRLTEAGLTVIVTDHHTCQARLPSAAAVINPHRPDSTYPFAALAGAGVALKLIHALCIRLDLGDHWQHYLDLAALGTVADVVALTGENRCLVKFGLDQLNGLARDREGRVRPVSSPGLLTLIRLVNANEKPVTAQMLGFSAAPRINASGRMGHARDALDLLLTDDPARALLLAEKLQDQNRQRQEVENTITAEAMAEIDSQFAFASQAFIVVARPDWHTGVIGIVASRLAEHYCRPVVVLSGDGQQYRGSCRSWGDIDMLAALDAASQTIIRYGGHRKAAGLTLAADQLEAFRLAIRNYADEHLDLSAMQPVLQADLVVQPDDLTLDNARDLARLEPFGEGNPLPRFVICNLQVIDLKQVGNGRHLKITVREQAGMRTWDGIAFGTGDADEWIGQGDQIDLLCSLEINAWQGRLSVQLNIRDIRLARQGNWFSDNPWEVEHQYGVHGSIRMLAEQHGLPFDVLYPNQQEYKAVYQYLSRRLGTSAALFSLTLLARSISRSYQIDLHPFRLARILAVFQESGLISQQDLSMGIVRVALLPVSERVSLSESPTFRRLQTEYERGMRV